MRTLIICIVVVIGLPVRVCGQQRGLMQLSGMVLSQDEEPLSFVFIHVKNRRIGTISDKNGLYTFIVFPHDTVNFTHIGYKPAVVVMKDSVTKHIIRDIHMEDDTVMIKELVVLPWKTYKDFKDAVLTIHLPESDYDHAKRNIDLIMAQAFDENYNVGVPMLNYKYVMQQHYESAIYKGMVNYGQFFNPIAWAKYLNALMNGEFDEDKNK